MTDKERAKVVEAEVERRAVEELDNVDYEELFRESLDDCFNFASVGGPFAHMLPSRVLEECDPTAFRCGANDHADSLCSDGVIVYLGSNYYDAKEVEAIRDEVEDSIPDADDAQ